MMKQAREISLILKSLFNIATGKQRSDILKGISKNRLKTAVISSRLKKEKAIKAKMARFGEPKDKILDMIGHRIIVSNLSQLERTVQKLRKIGQAPSKSQMLLRNGQLQFPWLRDYRSKTHKGRSSLTSPYYNEAVHFNRIINGMICEIQVLTYHLYVKAFVNRSGGLAHAQFARRRTRKFNKSL